MGEVRVTAEREIAASVEQVRAALADYASVRPKVLTEHFSEYEVRSGGTGAGTVAHWTLAATSKRVRDCLIEVSESGDGDLVERDANSSMVTTWSVTAAGTGSLVTVLTTWQGASGIGGFFERTFAPGGLRRIYDGVLANLAEVVTS